MNGNVSGSTDMATNRRAEVSVGIARDGSCYLTRSGMTFAILTMQEVKLGSAEGNGRAMRGSFTDFTRTVPQRRHNTWRIME